MSIDNPPSMSIAELLRDGTRRLTDSSDTARLDAELLLADCLQKNRAHLYTWPEKIPGSDAQVKFNHLIDQRKQGTPIAYLTGTREFWSLPFRVTRDTLVPRNDTELLVQLALDTLQLREGPVLDLGTGSGVIAISIATEHKNLPVDAIDHSEAALAVARDNARENNVDVQFIQSDWYQQVPRTDYQLIVSNPPYIAADDPHLHRGGLQFEPQGALVSAQNGLRDIAHIVANARLYMRADAWLLIEHGSTQGPATRQLMIDAGLRQTRTEQDIEARDRVSLGQI